MRTYPQYITKRRTRIKGISGTVNIPYGTILDMADGFIMYRGNRLCAVHSQNAKDYFWGYDEKDVEGEIERQKAVTELVKLSPDGSVEELETPDNFWARYGCIIEAGAFCQWKWKDLVYDLPTDRAIYLANLIKNGGGANG